MRRKPDELIPLEIAILEAALVMRRRGTKTFHGFAIAKVMKTEANRRTLTAHGTLYRALHRLELAGLIDSFWEEASLAENERRPRRRLYRLGALAEAAVARARARERSTGPIVLKPGFGTHGAR